MYRSTEEKITLLLAEMREGHAEAGEQVISLVYGHLRNIAKRIMRSERAGHTLQPTALVHEAWLKLTSGREQHYQDRDHFFCIAATAMRQILIDHARARSTKRRRVELEPNAEAAEQVADPATSRESLAEILALDQALAKLAKRDALLAKVVELRCFGDFTVEETASALGLSATTVKRQWQIAKAWLTHELS